VSRETEVTVRGSTFCTLELKTRYLGDPNKKDNICGTCSTKGKDDICIQNISRETGREETTSETLA
jgi:hypothetical protein